jgi:ABC-type uncharacterized transport system involved in gliding motility auxiliary subunit
VANRFLTVAGWLGTALVALAAGRFAVVDPRWDAYLVWIVVAGVACIAIDLAASWRDRSRRDAHAARLTRMTVPAVAAVALAIAVSILAVSYGRRWDLTANQVYQLSSETRVALQSLDAPVRVLLFAQLEDFPIYRDRLREYAEASAFVTIEYVDIKAQPVLVGQYDVREYGTAAIEYKGRIELVDGLSEQQFTNALVRLREGTTRRVYFTTGHAERDTASTERVGYSNAAAELRRENLVVEKLNFTQQAEVPADAVLVVVAGPRADFFPAEIDALRQYLERGGAVLFLVDPFEDLKRYITETGMALFMMDPSSVSVTGELRNLTAFIGQQGAELGNNVVVDTSDMGTYIGTDASVPVASRYPDHPITQGLSSLSAYAMARSVTPVPVEGSTPVPIIETTDRTWSETDIQSLAAGRFSMDPARGDRPGPVSLGVAVSRRPSAEAFGATGRARDTRLVVVGDSDFVANYSANVPGNAQMFLAIVRWLAQQKVVTIAPRVPEERVLTMSGADVKMVSWLALLLLPALAVGVAGGMVRNSKFKIQNSKAQCPEPRAQRRGNEVEGS